MKKALSLIISLVIAISIFTFPTVGHALSACNHKYDSACDTDCNLCGQTREADPHEYGEWTNYAEEVDGVYLTTTKRTCKNCGAFDTASSSNVISFSQFTPGTLVNGQTVAVETHVYNLDDTSMHAINLEDLNKAPTSSYGDSDTVDILIACGIGAVALAIILMSTSVIVRSKKKAVPADEGEAHDDDVYEPDNYIEN